MVEFALILPILLLIVMGIIEYGHIYADDEAIVNASRDGARYGTVHPAANTNVSPPASNTIQGVVVNAGTPASIHMSQISVTYYTVGASPTPVLCGTYNPSLGYVSDGTGTDVTSLCDVAGNMIEVKVTYTDLPLTPMMKAIMPSGTTFSSSTMMMIE